MTKERETIKEIIAIINNDGFKIGSSLPSERKLASQLNVSRNTLRNALHKLEARGIIDIRTGSGCYLLCKYGYFHDWLENEDIDSPSEIKNLLETRYLFEPSAVSLAAKKINDNNFKELEECLIRLSQAFLGMEKKDIINEDAQFRRIIYCSSGNRFLISAMNQINNNNHLFFKFFDQLSEFEKDSVFADYVEILKCLKDEDNCNVKKAVQSNILRMCEFLARYEGLQMPELINDAIKMKKESTEINEST
jgi:GntR family transcriptional regulator, transcriptional repressor for pyruvate dehydrogenase complex